MLCIVRYQNNISDKEKLNMWKHKQQVLTNNLCPENITQPKV